MKTELPRLSIACVACAIVTAACSQHSDSGKAGPASTDGTTDSAARTAAMATGEGEKQAAAAPASFANRVWQVASSPSVAPGTLYAFLTDGTLLITSADSRPALGQWKYQDGTLTMVEEGIASPVQVRELTAERLRLRISNPGEPTDITLVPAAAPPGLVAPVRNY